MAEKQAFDKLEQKVKDLDNRALEWEHTEKALRESTHRLEIAYEQSIIYGKELNEQISERRRAEEALQKAHDELEERVRQRTDELLRANDLLKREIADRKIADEALQESEVRLKTVLDTIQAGIVVIDPENHVIVGVNAAAGKMVGAPREHILGNVCHKFICPANEGECPATDLGENLDNAELVLLTASGRNVPILKTVVPVILSGREHLLESFLDITEHKRAEDDLRESEKRMYENQKHMEMLQFANDVARKMMHELRNPLAAIGGFAGRIASKDYPDDKLKEYAGIIQEQSVRLDKAVEEVLDHLKVAADSKLGSCTK